MVTGSHGIWPTVYIFTQTDHLVQVSFPEYWKFIKIPLKFSSETNCKLQHFHPIVPPKTYEMLLKSPFPYPYW